MVRKRDKPSANLDLDPFQGCSWLLLVMHSNPTSRSDICYAVALVPLSYFVMNSLCSWSPLVHCMCP